MFKGLIEDKKAVFFDLDGTLVDTKELWIKAYEAVNTKYQLSIPGIRNNIRVGAALKDNWDYFLHLYDVKTTETSAELAGHTDEAFLEELSKTTLEPIGGFFGLISEFKIERKLLVALVTNTRKSTTLEMLDRLGFKPEMFDLIIGGDEIKKKKPNPEIYKTALHKLKLQPKEVLAFEDSIAGATAAVDAKLDTIVVWDETYWQTDYPRGVKLFIKDFSDLEGKLDTDQREEFKDYVDYFVEIKKEIEKAGLDKENPAKDQQ